MASHFASSVWEMVPTTEAGGSVATYEWVPPLSVSVAVRSVWVSACSEAEAAAGRAPGLSPQARPKRRTLLMLATRAAPGSARREARLFVHMVFRK